MDSVQSALYHRPGKHCAVGIFRLRNGQTQEHAKFQIARLMNCFANPAQRPANLHVLCAINPALIQQPQALALLPRYGRQQQMPSTQSDLLIQISAMTHTDLLFALRICHALLQALFTCQHEWLGGQLRYDQEPFGFYHADGEPPLPIDKVARITAGQLTNGSWILYQRYVQALAPFYQLSLDEQANIMGAESVAQQEVSTQAYPETAHTRVVQAPKRLPQMIRRGFAYRQQAQEGTAFIAASAELKNFAEVLDRMLERDALLEFSEAVEGGIYFAPPNAEWLCPDAGTPQLPNEAKYLPLHLQTEPDLPPLSLQDYTVASAFVEYLNTLRALGLFEGPIGEQQFAPEVRVMLQAINDFLAGGKLVKQPHVEHPDPATKAQLDRLLEESLAAANRFNSVARKYMTLG